MKKTFAMAVVALIGTVQAKTVRVADFGYDPADSTRFLQSAIDSGAETVVVDRQAGPWVARPLFVTNATLRALVFEKGVELQAKRGEFRHPDAALLYVRSVGNLRISGYGATFRMWKSDYVKPPYEKSEHRHCLTLRACENVTVEGLRFEESGGDGIYLANGWRKDGTLGPCRNLTIRDVVCDRNHRQGLSVIGADGLVVENCEFSNTSGTPPESGVDLEPNNPHEILRGIVFRNVKTRNNRGCGIEFYLGAMNSTSAPVEARIENWESSGNSREFKYSCSRVRYDDLPRGGSVTLRNCSLANARSDAVLVQEKPATGAAITMEDVRIEAWGTSGRKSRAIATSIEMWDDRPVDGFVLRNVRARADAKEPWKLLDGTISPKGFPGFDDGRTPARKPVDYGKLKVDDAKPGEMVHFAGAALTTKSRVVFYADAKRPVRFAIEQIAVNGRRPPWRGGLRVHDLSAPSKKPRGLRVPRTNDVELVFNAPHRGFYALEFDAVKGAVRFTGADAPLAIDVTTSPQKLYGAAELCFLRREGETPAVIFDGRAALELFGPDGAEVWRSDAPDSWTRAMPDGAPGCWRMSAGRPAKGGFGYWRADLAGTDGFLFMTKEKTWH